MWIVTRNVLTWIRWSACCLERKHRKLSSQPHRWAFIPWQSAHFAYYHFHMENWHWMQERRYIRKNMILSTCVWHIGERCQLSSNTSNLNLDLEDNWDIYNSEMIQCQYTINTWSTRKSMQISRKQEKNNNNTMKLVIGKLMQKSGWAQNKL